MRCAIASAVALIGMTAPVLADVPVNDAAQLTQHSQTASTTVKLVPVTTQRHDANSGVKCAVTTGKKASVTDPTAQPQSGAGSKAIQSYAPDQPAAPDPSAQGAALNNQTLFKSSGDVVAGLDASRQTLSAAQTAFKTAGQQVGTATTVMAAIDVNSAARLQNDLAWNSAIGSANLWVMALNALNLALNSDTSRAARGMRATAMAGATLREGAACPVGMVGAGTAANPCHTPSTCSTTPAGSPADPACIVARDVDSDGNIVFYLSQAQGAANAAGDLNTITADDVAAGLAAIASNSR